MIIYNDVQSSNFGSVMIASTWAALGAATQRCSMVVFGNDTGVVWDVRRNGGTAGSALFPVFGSVYCTISGLNNLADVSVRRQDLNVASVTCKFEYLNTK